MAKIDSFLEKIGLNDKEKVVYLTGLKLGPVRAAYLSRRTGLTRQHTYDILKSLEQKGFVSRLGKDYGQRFVMEEPANLKGVLERKQSRIEKMKGDLEKLMPEFESFYNSKEAVPKIKFFEEVDGIKEIFEDMLLCQSKQHLYFGSFTDLIGILGKDYMDNWIERRVDKKIFSKAVRIKGKEISEEIYAGEEKFLREVRYAPENFKTTQTIVMYDNKVAVISSKNECVGFLVEGGEYFSTMENIFNLLWLTSNK